LNNSSYDPLGNQQVRDNSQYQLNFERQALHSSDGFRLVKQLEDMRINKNQVNPQSYSNNNSASKYQQPPS
jgi:hypothetical protein